MSDVVIVQRRRGCLVPFFLLLFLLLIGGLITLRSLGFIQPFFVPSEAMAPTVSNGDHVMMETFTYQSRKPLRGDVVVFKMEKSGQTVAAGTYVMRVVGLPGETLHLTADTLEINGKPVLLKNGAGKIHYAPLQEATYLTPEKGSFTVPAGSYFLMGDNTNASPDSRFFGPIPSKDILGRVSFCFWPSTRMSLVK